MATRVWTGIAAIALLIALGGCASRKVEPLPEAPAKLSSGAAQPGVEAKPAAAVASERPPMPGGAAPGESIYFAAGASDIDSEGMALLRLCADRLKSDGRQRVTLVGLTDDLGSRAYNLAIADQRLSTVQLALRRMGVAAYQIKRRNLGGEPARNRCADEACRKQMRRVELHCGD